MRRILPIVEGDGDVKAVPLLIRRVLHELHNIFDVEVLPAQKRGEWPKVKQDFRRYYLAARLEKSPILWVVDFDCKECVDPMAERAWLEAQAESLDPSGRIEIAFMIKEYECLFLQDKASVVSSFPELDQNTVFPASAEEIRDAKGWISKSLPVGRSYKPTTDQARLTARLDLQHLRQVSASFNRFERAILKLLD